jgi:CubicO group peptidase (beta-lactamase class C family)
VSQPARAATATAGASAAGRARELFRLLDEKITAGMRDFAIPGVAVGVLYQGHVHLRGFGVTNTRYPAPVTPDTLFRAGSTTKTFTGTAVMRLADAGRLELGREVRHYLPGFQAPPGAAAVTVRELLNHTAGWLGQDLRDTGRGTSALPRYVAGIHRLPQLTPPGTVFSYNNAAIALAGYLIERVTGTTYEYAIRDLLLAPLGLRHSFFFSDEIIGYRAAASHTMVNGTAVPQPRDWYLPRSVAAAGGLICTATDLLRWARFHLGDGRAPDGRRLLSPASLAGMRTRPGPGGTDIVELTGIGVTWQLRPTAQGVRIVQHGGDWHGERSGFLMVPEQGFALTLLANSVSASGLLLELFVKDWAIELFTGLTNLPARQRRLSPAQLAAYEGRYRWQEIGASGRVAETVKTMTARDGSLYCVTTGANAEPPLVFTFYDSPAGPDYVLRKDASGTPTGLRCDFIRDPAGQVRWFRYGGGIQRREQ